MQKDFVTATPDTGGAGGTTVNVKASANSGAAPNFKNEKDAPKKYIVDYLMVKLMEDERFMEKATDTQTVALKLANFLIKNNYIKTRIDQLDSGQIKVVYWVNTFKEDEH